MTPDEVARRLFRPIVAAGRSTNTYLPNGARLYLDVGSHPEYATAECDSLPGLIAQDKAGERIVADLVAQAQAQLDGDGITGSDGGAGGGGGGSTATIHAFKNNTDSAGHSFGCHENYSLARSVDLARVTDALIPFLVTRNLLVGAGKVLPTLPDGRVDGHSADGHAAGRGDGRPAGARYVLSQRAVHMATEVSTATTRDRPMINTRDEPHADAAYYRRLHIIVGDSNLAEPTILLKVGAMTLLLNAIEAGLRLPDLTLDNPARAIRAVSSDRTGRIALPLRDGGSSTALDLQRGYLALVQQFVSDGGCEMTPPVAAVLDLWERGLDAIETGDLRGVDRELDWVIKWRLIERYLHKMGLDEVDGLADPRVARLDLAYHDLSPTLGLYNLLAARSLVERVISDDDVAQAVTQPPQTTRAALRGRFIAAAQAARRDYMVDWTHLKVTTTDQTVTLTDPFAAVDDRVDSLIASL
jgi:proteasome accessory factor A